MRILYSARFYPNVYVSKSPFKILEYRHLVALTRFSGKELVLDLGCGSGLQTLLLAKRAQKVIGLDIGDLSKAEEKGRRVSGRLNVEFFRGRIQEAPFPDEMFDKIFCICVLEHIPEYRQVLERCHKLLNDDGEMLLSVDSLAGVPSDLIDVHARQHSVSQYFHPEELGELLRGLSFSKVEIHPILCSRFATRMFSHGIRTRFSYTAGGAIVRWLVLSASEAVCPKRKEGVFLVAHCSK